MGEGTTSPSPAYLHLILLLAEHDVIWCGICLWPIGVSCPSGVPPQPIHCGSTEWGEKEKPLTLHKPTSALDKAQLCYRCCFSYKSKPQHCLGCWESELHPVQSQYSVLGDPQNYQFLLERWIELFRKTGWKLVDACINMVCSECWWWGCMYTDFMIRNPPSRLSGVVLKGVSKGVR